MNKLPSKYFITIDIPKPSHPRGFVRDLQVFVGQRDSALNKFYKLSKVAQRIGARSIGLYEGTPPDDKYNFSVGGLRNNGIEQMRMTIFCGR